MGITDHYETIYVNCRRTLGLRAWGRVRSALDQNSDPYCFPELLQSLTQKLNFPDFMPDMARLEWFRYQAQMDKAPIDGPREAIAVNPTLGIYPVSWRHLVTLIETGLRDNCPLPERGSVHVLIWRHPQTGEIHLREAGDIDLLAVKITVEQIEPREAAAIGHVTVGEIQASLDRAVSTGLLLAPESRIRRLGQSKTLRVQDMAPYVSTDTFTLQWHITQACDLHCKHCYDRSSRPSMPLDSALAVLDEFYAFCRNMHVAGHVTFTGGNPLLYPRFSAIYKAAADYGFGLAILGNPASREQLAPLCDIAKPSYYQISLEGLADHNDDIRGKGHFERSLHFLDLLKDLNVYSMVMLTLTRDNMDQVLPLAAMLRNRAEAFNFNRLSAVGEGAHLSMPTKDQFESFLRSYTEASEKNSMLGLKDNLINIIREEKGMPPFGGCTGYGCGAAFNFIALLSDGEVHACRKFPSPIGNIRQSGLLEIYESEAARRYRRGGEACADCRLSTVCRGCLAVTYSLGLDPFKARDPFCFAPEAICSSG